MPKKETQKSDYNAESIKVLEGLEPVRKTPGMYIGSTGPDGLHHLIWECVDNAIDEAIGGYATHVIVRLLPNGAASVSDNGRGIPVGLHSQTKKSALETVMTHLHAGGKFGTGAYKVSGGLHGVGVSIVNALSVHMTAEVKREGYTWKQEYERGKPLGPVKKGKATTETGTTQTFTPDDEIFKEREFDLQRIIRHLRSQAFLTPRVRITIVDERAGDAKPFEFYFENGVRSFLEYLVADRKPVQENIFFASKEKDDIAVDVAFTYVEDSESVELAFANNVRNPEGGMHLTGLRAALTKVFNDYAKTSGSVKENAEGFTGDDTREGIVTIISVKLRNPQFEGQTKMKLGNPEVRPVVESIVSFALKEFLQIHGDDAKRIMQKLTATAQARLAAKSAKEAVLRKGALSGMTLPGKLADCTTRKAEEAELFIVEGDSAGGSAKMARDRQYQAVYPPFGKILNIERVGLDKMLSSEKIKNLIIVLGTGIGADFNINKLRYHKVIFAHDADVDGNHIRTLWLTFFYHYLRPVIEHGYLYIAQPPLYKIQQGKQLFYAYSDAEKDKILKQFKDKTPDVQRYKGLGEMNAEELWETTMDPARRVLKQVTIDDAVEAERILNLLMGKEVEPRRRFIETYAQEVKNLDV